MADDFALFDVDGKGHITPGDLDAVGFFYFCKNF
jgi:Ca2+-binding EF-hand superfamily protein